MSIAFTDYVLEEQEKQIEQIMRENKISHEEASEIFEQRNQTREL